MPGLLPSPDPHRVSQVGCHFYLKPALCEEITEKALAMVFFLQTISRFFLGFHVSSPRSQDVQWALHRPGCASIVPLHGREVQSQLTRAVRSSARARGMLMCTFNSKCWGSLFPGHRRGADNHDSGKEASSWVCSTSTQGLWLLEHHGISKARGLGAQWSSSECTTLKSSSVKLSWGEALSV